jgi:RNA recognition motif-containing protein
MKNIFVGNLGFETSEHDIRYLFEPYGVVQRVKIITNRDTGQSRGVAFVEMPHDGEAEKAIAALNGTQLTGRPLNINEARQREDRGFGVRSSSEKRFGGPSRRQPLW